MDGCGRPCKRFRYDFSKVAEILLDLCRTKTLGAYETPDWIAGRSPDRTTRERSAMTIDATRDGLFRGLAERSTKFLGETTRFTTSYLQGVA